jgi:protein-disulfide isomerase
MNLILNRLVESNKDKIVIYYHYMPFGDKGTADWFAAAASVCANKWGGFNDYHNMLYSKMTDWAASEDPKTIFVEYANTRKWQADDFRKCLSDKNVDRLIERDVRNAHHMGLQYLPSIIINDRYYIYGYDTDLLKKRITQLGLSYDI